MANITFETASYEQIIGSNTAKSLQKELHLTEAQIAKGNLALLDLLGNEKLNGATQISKMRFAYRTALLDYKNPNALAPVKYGDGVMAQPQYQAFQEDMIECGGVTETNAVPLYKGFDYKPRLNKWGYKEITLVETELKSPFDKLEIVGWYAYAKCKDGTVITCLMSNEEIDAWSQRYSISQRKFKEGNAKSSIWDSDYEKMCRKTVIKAVARLVLQKYPFDRLAKLIEIDQQVFTDEGVSYADNPNVVGEVRESDVTTHIAPQE